MIYPGTNAVRDAEGAACQWHAFSTDRAGGETASSNLVASIPWQGRRKHWINSVSGSFFVFLFFFCGSLRIFCHNSLDYHMLFYVQHMDMKRSAAAEKAFAISWDPAGETADETVEGFRAVMRQFHLKFFLHFFQ